jgi:16S rRNA C967 or C1407 C5-methylase (RsmB/RsmF family)
VRKRREALNDWSQALVERKAKEQKHYIVRAFDYLKEGGEMVYSTCTFAPEEDEEVVLHLLKERDGTKGKGKAVVVPVVLQGIQIRPNDLCNHCVRLYPQDNDTQQFFFAKIKKLTAGEAALDSEKEKEKEEDEEESDEETNEED